MTESSAVTDQNGSIQLELTHEATAGYLRDQLGNAERQIENLEAALVNARKIGAAVGVVMATEKLTYEQAFSFLSKVSQRGNEKLVRVAERVLLTGSAMPWPR